MMSRCSRPLFKKPGTDRTGSIWVFVLGRAVLANGYAVVGSGRLADTAKRLKIVAGGKCSAATGSRLTECS